MQKQQTNQLNNMNATFRIEGITAISATKIDGVWILSLTYGRAHRRATPEECAILDRLNAEQQNTTTTTGTGSA